MSETQSTTDAVTVNGATAQTMLKNLNSELARKRPRRMKNMPSLQRVVQFRVNKFDTRQFPRDLARVVARLTEQHGENYALHVAFAIRTAVELHRAWHMTLLTSSLMEQLKEKFDLRLTWTLGVLRLKFRIEDGDYELHRKVPYDYDSEFQDKYLRIATALIDGHIDVHKALNYQIETKQGKHTAQSGLFLRRYPGRLLLYPLEAATCAVIFFGGDWTDSWVAAVCGFAAGLIEWQLQRAGKIGGVLLDVLVGCANGIIVGLFYRHTGEMGQGICISSVLLGTLYWFFYGTAFVIGLLEVIAGELETGVTRFIAVSVKTFVLCLGAGFGMLLTLERTSEIWAEQSRNCGAINLDQVWWRIPLYLLCSASALGQYRFPIVGYWRGLVVQFVAYEVQYQALKALEKRHDHDNMDYAASNVVGAMAAVVAACILSFFVESCLRRPYYARLLHRKRPGSKASSRLDRCMFNFVKCCMKSSAWIGLGRRSEIVKLKVEKKIQAAADPTRVDVPAPIVLEEGEENVLVEAIVGAQNHNIWAVLMPAVYQLVPGSMIAKLWFNSIFPPSIGTDEYQAQSNVYSNLMVISTSLALGLILGFSVVRVGEVVTHMIAGGCCRCCCPDQSNNTELQKSLSADEMADVIADATHDEEVKACARDRMLGMFTAQQPHQDPDDVVLADIEVRYKAEEDEVEQQDAATVVPSPTSNLIDAESVAVAEAVGVA